MACVLFVGNIDAASPLIFLMKRAALNNFLKRWPVLLICLCWTASFRLSPQADTRNAFQATSVLFMARTWWFSLMLTLKKDEVWLVHYDNRLDMYGSVAEFRQLRAPGHALNQI